MSNSAKIIKKSYQLRSQCFVVCQEMNFRKAAEQLNMTQPPLTRQIQALEDLIGQSLFLRDTHEVLLTNVGKELLNNIEPFT